MAEVKFKCIITNERFYNSESSWGVFVFNTDDEIPEYSCVQKDPFDNSSDNMTKMSTLAGNMQQLYIGSEYEVIAELEYNKKYNSYQYKPKIITSTVPKTHEQQAIFLQSIVTQKQAETLLSVYPNIVDDVINNRDNVDLSLLSGIGELTYNRIRECIVDNYVISDVITLLQPLGVTYKTVKRLLMDEPNPALLKEKLLDDPYIILKMHGFGWKKVDDLALKIKPDIKVSNKRVYAFIKYMLKETGDAEGHTWCYLNELDSAISTELNECKKIYDRIIKNEIECEMILHFDNSKGRVGLKNRYEKECNILDVLKDIKQYKPLEVTSNDIVNGINKSESEQGFQLTEEQRRVVTEVTKNNVSIIVGRAGCGKTTISRTVLKVYEEHNYSISCCAFSARAAQRITEATGFDASTIHRLLGFNPTNGFNHNHDNPLSADVILVDECSMINVPIFLALLSAIKPGAKIIMCGDSGQLPPIGYGNVFGDIINRKEFNVCKLTKVLRQAEDSGILRDANLIRKGIMPISQPELKTTSGTLQDMTYMFRDSRQALQQIAIKAYMKSVEEVGVDNVAIVVPRRDTCDNSALELNKIINDLVIEDKIGAFKYGERTYYIGSKVMQIENNYEKNVFNGEIGYVTEIDNNSLDADFKFVVEFKMNNQIKTVQYSKAEIAQLDLAYAITCHKIQGGSAHTVIVIIDMTHYSLLDTCMLYTALTRAKKKCLLLAEPLAFKKCIDNNKSKDRKTWLSLI